MNRLTCDYATGKFVVKHMRNKSDLTDTMQSIITELRADPRFGQDFSNWTIIALKQFWFDPMHCENRIRVEEQTPHLFPLYSAPTPKTPAQSLSQVALASDPIMIAIRQHAHRREQGLARSLA